MSVLRIRSQLLAALAVATLAGCSQSGTDTVDATARAQALLARDVQAIQNLMSRRAFYHSAGRNDLEFALYSKRADISWGQNQGFQVGPATIKHYYVDGHVSAEKADLERMSKLYPQLNNDPSNLGAGSFVIHSLTTPIIEVAGDGQTAKGVWYTPGAIGITDAKGKLNGDWLWERYAADFIKEDGQWHFWHILVLTDFLSPMGKDLQPPPDAVAVAPVGSESKSGSNKAAMATQVPAGSTQWTIVNENYKSWTATTVPTVAPRLPEPYRTFSETFSYGPPAQ
jgi:SnoaL-like domain